MSNRHGRVFVICEVELIDCHRRGMSIRKIAEAFDISRTAATARLERLGLHTQVRSTKREELKRLDIRRKARKFSEMRRRKAEVA